MIEWIHSNWDTVVAIGSIILNVLGGLGIVPPLRKKPTTEE